MDLHLTRVRQQFDTSRIEDVQKQVHRELETLDLGFSPGASIAVAAGSRGIGQIDLIVKAAIDWLKAQGARPFIVPAMGSHGGATAEGQIAVLASFGITELSMGAPIRSSMDVVELPAENLQVKLYMDAWAYQSDGVVLINRIKPHTDFHGSHESGLAKMCVIGLGKHKQALAIHRHGVYGLKELMPRAAKQILAGSKVLAGLAIVENAYDQPALIKALTPRDILSEETALLQEARQRMPSLPIENLDLLIVDRIGKDISGTCLDTNIIGRLYIPGQQEPETPQIKTIVARDLTDGSHGNAIGVGLADVITRTLFDKIDIAATRENAYTSTFLVRAKIPLVAESDKEAIHYALRAAGPLAKGRERIVRIRDTLSLSELLVSDTVAAELNNRPTLEVTGEILPLVNSTGSCPLQ